MLIKKLLRLFLIKTPKIVIWEITTSCNCKCDMCNVWKKKSKFLKLNKAKELVDFMYNNGVVLIQITGGEPTLYKHLIPLLTYINKKGMFLNLATNGTTITKNYAKKLKSTGIRNINVSLDDFKEKIHDKIRNYKGCFKKAINAINILKKEGFHIHSSSMINKYNHKHIKEFVTFVNDLGISFAMCYPYPTFNKKDNVSRLKNKDLVRAIKELIKLKTKSAKISNSLTFLKESLNYAKNKKMKYPCLAGLNVYALNQKGEFKTCWILPDKFTIKSGWKEKKINCNKCNLGCFREPSIYAKMIKNNKLGFLKEVIQFI